MFDHGEFSIVSKRNKVNEYLFRTIFRGISALSSYIQGVYKAEIPRNIVRNKYSFTLLRFDTIENSP